MSVRRAWRRVANEVNETAVGIERASQAAEDLERAAGAPGGGGLGPQSQASSIAPVGGGGGLPSTGGKGARIGGGGSAGAEGIKAPESNRGALAAIIEESGVAAPSRDEWPPNGLTDAPPGFIVATVLSLGTKAPVNFLIWCAGLLAYTNADDLAAKASRHGGGYRAATWGRDPRSGDYNYTGSGFMDRPGQHWNGRDNPNAIPTFDRGGQTNLGQSGMATSQGISSSQASSIATASEKSANLLGLLVNQVSQLNANLSTAAGGVGVRAGRV